MKLEHGTESKSGKDRTAIISEQEEGKENFPWQCTVLE